MGKSAVHAVILAAGKATRFGRDKLTVEYQGKPLIAHVLATVGVALREQTISGGFVMLRPGATVIADLATAAGLTPVTNPDADLGVSESIRRGLAAAQATGSGGAVLIIPGDQPHVRLDVITLLVEAWRNGEGPVLRPHYGEDPDSPNHPVLLDASVWQLADQLSGDTGFAAIFRARPELVTSIAVPGRNPDMDTPRDLSSTTPSR